MDEPPVAVEPLGPHHDRASFACGEPALDRYLRRQAAQDGRRRTAQVCVATGGRPQEIIGYYTLSAASFERDRLLAALARRLPHYPVPAVVIGRLAVDRKHQGRGLGEFLLLNAIRRVVRAGDVVGVYAIVVDAKNDGALAFYERYGFRSFPSTARRLFLPLATLEKLGL